MTDHHMTSTRSSTASPALLEPLAAAWRHRELIYRLTLRDLHAQFRGSFFGWLWLVVPPLGLIAFYSLSFAAIPSLAMLAKGGNMLLYPLFIFCGLIYFQTFADVLVRSPQLLAENVGFIKKVIFPVEVLAWILAARSLLVATALVCVLLVFATVVDGIPGPSVILIPLIFAGFAMMVVGTAWILSVFGVFTRDLTYLISSVMPALLLATPLFYSVDDVRPALRPFLYVNPLTSYVEATRAIIVAHTYPHWFDFAAALGLGVVMLMLGYALFVAMKPRIVDVL